MKQTLPFLLLFAWLSQTHAASDEQFAVIKQLGQLNGIALHCKALPETQRMKRALVLNLPKRRQLGELFDIESHQSFMQFISDEATCPPGSELNQRVSDAITELEAAFQKQ